MEIQYIRCCRNQNVKGILGKLRRFEFIEYFVRIGKSSFPFMSTSLSLMIYISLFMKPYAEKSTFLKERESIKACMPLNKSLHENRGGIDLIFNKLKGTHDTMIHKTKMSNYTKELMKSNPDFDNIKIHSIFVYSLEIIVDDVKETEKYHYITYSEFIEYLCRVALIHFKDASIDTKEGKLEYKLVNLLKIMYEDEGILDPVKAKIRSPHVDISFCPINEDEECC